MATNMGHVDQGIEKQPIVLCRNTSRTLAARHLVFDDIPLSIGDCVTVNAEVPPWFQVASGTRLFTALEYNRGDPANRHEERRVKLQQGRHSRRERNLNLRQSTLPPGNPGTNHLISALFVPLPLKRNVSFAISFWLG